MPSVSGGCHCGNVRVELQLPRDPEAYVPRACDCDFCRKHAAAYVSDPHGALRIWIRDERRAGRYHQGSGTAEMLVCRNCGVLIGALYPAEGSAYGAVNVRTLEERARFAPEQSVSPQSLSASDKVRRWREIWFADVSIIAGGDA